MTQAPPSYDDLSRLVDEEYGVVNKTGLAELCASLNRIEHLTYWRGFLEHCGTSPKHVFFAFNQMNRILRHRGCTMNPEVLENILAFFIDSAGGKAQMLIARREVLNAVSEGLAVTSRLVFEAKNGDMTSLGAGLMKMMQQNTVEHQTVALKVMDDVCDVFKEDMRHLDLLTNTNVRTRFKDKLPEFFDIAVKILNEAQQPDIFHGALCLLLRILKYFDTNSNDSRSELHYPDHFRILYQNDEIIQRIFTAFQDPQITATILELLYYIVSSSKRMWNDMESKLAFFNCVTDKLIGLMQEPTQLLPLSRLCCKIVCQVDRQFLGQPSAQAFFDSAAGLSRAIFTQAVMEQDALTYMLKFWREFSQWATPDDGVIAGLVGQMFGGLISTLLEQIGSEPDKWKEDVETIGQDVFRNLWSLAEISYGNACQMVVEHMRSRMSGPPSALLELALLVRIVSARLVGGASGGVISAGDRDQMTEQLFVTVIEVIDQTNQSIEQVMKSLGQDEIVFERALLEFMTAYQNHLGGRMDSQKNEQAAQIMQVFVKRLLILLTSGLCDSKTMTTAILVIQQMISKPVLSATLQGSQFMQDLQRFSLCVSFDHLADITESKRPRKCIFALYMMLIQNEEQLRDFLGQFDGRFKSIASEQDAFIVYTELRGVFEGVHDQTWKYNRLLQWFSRLHFADTVAVIERFAGNPIVVKAVCHLWVSIFPDKAMQKNKRFSTNSGFGITLFKSSFGIIQAVLNGNTPDAHKIVILFRVIRNCLISESVNFGVMEFYNDTSYKQLVGLFYDLLRPAVQSSIMDVPKMVLNILESIASITRVMGGAFFADEERVKFTLAFLHQCLLHHKVAAKNTADEIWKYIWEALREMLDVCSSVDSLNQAFGLFEPHFFVIMDNMINDQEAKYTLDTSLILMYEAVYNKDFVQRFIGEVCNTSDGQCRAAVEESFMALLNGVCPPITEQAKKNFISKAGSFRSFMRRYPVSLSAIPSMAPYFH